jgi:hypothetical protein
MPRAETKIVRINAVADEQFAKVAIRLGVSKAALLAGLAAWAERTGMPSAKTPVDLHKAIAEADRDAGRRHADGAQRGRDVRSAQAAKRLPVT